MAVALIAFLRGAIRSNSSKAPVRFLRNFRFYPLRFAQFDFCSGGKMPLPLTMTPNLAYIAPRKVWVNPVLKNNGDTGHPK
jgi:hypothetical protein